MFKCEKWLVHPSRLIFLHPSVDISHYKEDYILSNCQVCPYGPCICAWTKEASVVGASILFLKRKISIGELRRVTKLAMT
jgi:hypothetical protein